jgi:hypothetical protein
MRGLPAVALASLLVSACVAPPAQPVFEPSARSAVELRAMQTRIVEGEENAVLRGVVATLQDLGYRITRAEAGAGTVSATRLTGLRLAVVVRGQADGRSLVRANATVLGLGRERQVDSPEFYLRNFFIPLRDTIGREMLIADAAVAAPEALRPTAEVLPGQRAPAAAGPTPATGGSGLEGRAP